MTETEDGMNCPNCGESHTDWTEDGQHKVSGPYHSGVADRYKCDRCGEIVEVHRR